MAQMAPEASLIGDRSAPYMIGIEANGDDPAQDAANRAWAREVVSVLQPFATGGGYLNFDDLSDPDALRRAQGADVARPAEVKGRYDPDDLCRARRAG